MDLLDLRIRLIILKARHARKIRNFFKALFPSVFECEYLCICPNACDNFTCFDGGGDYCGTYIAFQERK